MANLSVARIIKSSPLTAGVVLTIRTCDENCIDLQLSLSFAGSPQAQRISGHLMSRLVEACGKVEITDTEELHNINFIVQYRGDKVIEVLPLQVVVEKLLPMPSRKKVFKAGFKYGMAAANMPSMKKPAKMAWRAYNEEG